VTTLSALNQYNLSEDAETRAKFAKRMAKYIAAAPPNGFTVEEVTQGQIYPSSEVLSVRRIAAVEEVRSRLVWGFSCQAVVFWVLLTVLCSERETPFFVPSPAIRFPEPAEGVKGPKR
jgi:hypothetical protein